MSQLWTELASWWIRLAIAGGLFLLAGLLLVAACRQPIRRLRIGSWTVAIALLLVPMTFLPAWLRIPVPVAHQKTPAAKAENKQFLNHESAALNAVPGVEPQPAAAFIPPNIANVPAATALAPVTKAPSPEPMTVAPNETAVSSAVVLPPSPETRNDSRWIAWICNGLLIAYCVVVLSLLVRLTLGQIQLIRLWRAGCPAPLPIRQIFHRMTRKFRCKPALRLSDRIPGPICFGIIRPRIVLPAGWANLADEQSLRWVFAHELSHLERRDPLFGWLIGFAQSLFFFWPWFWKLRREVRLNQEYLADASAVRMSNQTDRDTPAEDYADFLVRLTSSGAIPLAASGVKSPSSDLFRRITMLLKKSGHVDSTCPRRWSFAAGFALLALGLIFAGFQLSAKADAQTDKKADAPKKESVDDIEKEVQKALDALRKGPAAEPRKEKEEREAPARDKVEENLRKAEEAKQKAEKDMAANPNDETRKAFHDAVRAYQEALRARIQANQVRPFMPLVPLNPLGGDPADLQKMMEAMQRQMMEQMRQMPVLPQINGNDPADIQKAMEDMQRQMMEQIRQMQQFPRQGFGPGARFGGNPRGFGRLANRPEGDVRLGVRLEKPNPALIEQLDLPANKGMVVTEVVADSSAAKAGIKNNDIIFEIGGKTVPSDANELHTIMNQFKANEKVDVVLVRKGKKTVIKDVVLPEAREERRVPQVPQIRQPFGPQFLPVVPPGANLRGQPAGPGLQLRNLGFPNLQNLPGGENAQMSITVNNGEFTIKYTTDGVDYTIVGSKEDGGGNKVTSIDIVDGDKKIKAGSLDKLDEQYKPTVEKLLKQIR